MFEPITFLRDVFDFIEANYQQPISLSDVAQSVGYSAAELTSLVRRQTGKTVFRWIIERRMAEAHSLLLQADLSVEQIAAAVSYSDVAYFHHLFRKYHNMTPQEWRRNILVQHGVNK